MFEQAFEKAELAKFRQADWEQYEASLKVFRDNKATYDYAVETAYEEGTTKGMIEGKIQGRLQGIAEGKIEMAKMMKAGGEPVEKIIRYTGLSEDEISKL